jgi:hypothetical protein
MDAENCFIYDYFIDSKCISNEIENIFLSYIYSSLYDLNLKKCIIAVNKKDRKLSRNILNSGFSEKYKLKAVKIFYYVKHQNITQ